MSGKVARMFTFLKELYTIATVGSQGMPRGYLGNRRLTYVSYNEIKQLGLVNN